MHIPVKELGFNMRNNGISPRKTVTIASSNLQRQFSLQTFPNLFKGLMSVEFSFEEPKLINSYILIMFSLTNM